MDIGGTSSRARLRASGARVIDVEGPGANVATLDPRLVDERLSGLLARLGPAHPDSCCAGAAGAEVPPARLRLERMLERMLPGCRIAVVHDARLVLAAAGLQEGIALIAGTGSVAYGRTAGDREAQRGGWGWMLGDEGGGTWIARDGAREVMSRAEAGRAIGPLGEAMLAASGASDARQMASYLHALREPMQWAALASAVFDSAASDSGAMEIVMRAAGALAELVSKVQESLGLQGPVVLGGGLILNQPVLESAVREQLDAPCVRLDQPPVEGALRMAEALLHS